MNILNGIIILVIAKINRLDVHAAADLAEAGGGGRDSLLGSA
jgi:hypothetical protein